MSILPQPKDLHARAAESAKETRSTIITLSTASIGALFFIVTGKIEPALGSCDRYLLLLTIVFMVASLASAIWFSFCDAQWSYYWGVELDSDRSKYEVVKAAESKGRWHRRKSRSEKAMLLFFVVAALAGSAFVLSRTFVWSFWPGCML